MAGLEERERRATVRLVSYWLSLRRGQGIPAFVDFDPHRNPIAWDQCLLASCGGGDDIVLEHVGSALAAVDLDGAGGPSMPKALGFINEILLPLHFAVASGEPQRASGSFRLRGGRRLLYRSVLLPFRSLDGARQYVLGAATFKAEPAPPEETAASERSPIEEHMDMADTADAGALRGSCAAPKPHHGDP